MTEDPFGRRDEEEPLSGVPGGWLPPRPGGEPGEPAAEQAPERPAFRPPSEVPGGPAPGPGERRNAPNSTAALVLGIVGLIVCPFVCSVLAIVLGRRARREIDASGGRLGGRGNATAAIVLGWVGIGFALLFVVLLAVGAVALDGGDGAGNGEDALFSLLAPGQA